MAVFKVISSYVPDPMRGVAGGEAFSGERVIINLNQITLIEDMEGEYSKIHLAGKKSIIVRGSRDQWERNLEEWLDIRIR